MISGGTLTPGQPADFRLGPVDSRTLFTGDHSFRLEVPEAASRITFTLESVDPDVDVDMFVRFGQNNDLRDGTVVTDYFSGGPTGNERIGITRRSNPPLRVGTYFVSLGVRTTGLVAKGTVTAKVETDAEDCHLDVTCYPEWSSFAAGVALIVIETSEGGSRACSGTLLNNRRQDFTPYFLTAAHCVDTDEEARSVIVFWNYQTQTCNGGLLAFQSVPRTEGARLLSTLGGHKHLDGDMTLLLLEGDLPDDVWFQGWDADPQPVGTPFTAIHHPGSDDWGFFKRISFGQIISGPSFRTSDGVYAFVSFAPGQGYAEPGSSGAAILSSSGTVVGALSGGDIVGNACPTGPVRGVATHFSVFYPHIQQFIDGDSPLTPGQPATFRLEPVDTPTIFLGGSSFRLEVPENASRVTFTLESVDPDINVDLYVRYGEDNDIRDGRVISDYSSEGPTGNEEIIITRQSDPPLRAGTYFVSLGVRTTGVVAEGTVRAEFDTPLQTGDQIYYFPHLAVGASWQTTITYINYSPEEVTCQTDFISDHGTPLTVSFPGRGRVFSRTDVLPPGGSVHQETDVDLSAPLAPGWARGPPARGRCRPAFCIVCTTAKGRPRQKPESMQRQFRQPGLSPLPNREKVSLGQALPMQTLPPYRSLSPLLPGTGLGRCWPASFGHCHPEVMMLTAWRSCLVSPALPDRSKSPPRSPSSVCRSISKPPPYFPPCLRGNWMLPPIFRARCSLRRTKLRSTISSLVSGQLRTSRQSMRISSVPAVSG